MHFVIFQYSVIIACGIATGLIGLYVLLNNYHRAINRFFALFSIGIALWNLGLALLFFSHAAFFITLILEGAIILSIGLFFFSKVFPTGTVSRNDGWLVIPMIGIAVLVPFKAFISDVTVMPSGYIVPHNQPLFWLYGLSLGFYLIGALYLLIRKYIRSAEAVRATLRHFFAGVILLVVVGLLCDVVLPSLSLYEFNLFGPLTSLLFVAATAYSIVWHNLMDIRIVLQRGLIYVTLLGIIVLTYVCGLQFLGYLLQKATDMTSIISAGITMVLGAFFMQPLQKYFEKITDPIFFKNKYIYSEALKQLSRMLNTTMSQADVIAASSVALKEIFKTKYVQFSLNAVSPKEALEMAISLPIVFEHTVIGSVQLGAKQSGDSYSHQDMQLLETFLHQAAVALEKGRLYEQVERYTVDLEHTVEERTKEIKKIQQDQKQSMIDISHNLQTPLAVIQGELELMTEYSGYASDSGRMVAVKRSLMRVSEFIRQLLHLARLDGLVYDLTFSSLDLSDLLQKQAEYFEVMGNEQQLTVTASIQDGVVLPGNKRLLEEAFTNIAQNAIKYRRTNSASTFHIALIETDAAITISLDDNGIGIAPESISEIFTRFYRAAQGTERSQGVGLGLAIVKKIIEMHHGSISVSSMLGVGTRFEIVWPKEKVDIL